MHTIWRTSFCLLIPVFRGNLLHLLHQKTINLSFLEITERGCLFDEILLMTFFLIYTNMQIYQLKTSMNKFLLLRKHIYSPFTKETTTIKSFFSNWESNINLSVSTKTNFILISTLCLSSQPNLMVYINEQILLT